MTEIFNAGDRVRVAATNGIKAANGTVDRDLGGEVVKVAIDGETYTNPHKIPAIPREAVTLIESDEQAGDLPLSGLLLADSVTVTSEFIAMGTDAQNWVHREYRATLHFEGRTLTTPYKEGGEEGGDPTALDVMDILVSQAWTAEIADDYRDWASGFAIDPEQWMSEDEYKIHLEDARRLREFLGGARFERYAMAEHDA
ncbi:hypothetical protein AB0E08_08425 [Streptomyces sp. NPDC048281]|uniref:hypothetical protein n=1 Tax=Streptomyces sp. NPDC048281 TaxID=3154715 RepID=UPI003439CC2A